MTAREIKASVAPGTVWDVTNHYITREDHPCYGTTRRAVSRVTTSRVYFAAHVDGGRSTELDWPKAEQIQCDESGVIRVYGGGAAQMADALFLTLRPVEPCAVDGCDKPGDLRGDLIRCDAHAITLERCVCGGCYDCPDGWHYGAGLPCACTPECATTTGGDSCPDCNGSCAVPALGGEPPELVDNGYVQCPTCKGTGVEPLPAACMDGLCDCPPMPDGYAQHELPGVADTARQLPGQAAFL